MEAQFTYHYRLAFVFLEKNIFSLIYLNATSLGNKHVVDFMYLNYLFVNLSRKTWFSSRNDGMRLLGYKRERVYEVYKEGGEIALSFSVNLIYEALFEYSIINFDYKAYGVKCCSFERALNVLLDMSLSFLMRNVLEVSIFFVVFYLMSTFSNYGRTNILFYL